MSASLPNQLVKWLKALPKLQSASAAMGRVFEFLDEEEMEDESQKTRQLEVPKGHVTFEHVRFGYSPDKTIIMTLQLKLSQDRRWPLLVRQVQVRRPWSIS